MQPDDPGAEQTAETGAAATTTAAAAAATATATSPGGEWPG